MYLFATRIDALHLQMAFSYLLVSKADCAVLVQSALKVERTNWFEQNKNKINNNLILQLGLS